MDSFWGWFGVTIVFPVIAPVALLCLAYYLKKFRPALHPFQALKDGQLLWFSAAISVAGIVDVIDAEKKHHSDSTIWAILFLALVVLASIASVAIMLEEPQTLPTDKNFWETIKEMRLMTASFIISVCAIAACAFAHTRA